MSTLLKKKLNQKVSPCFCILLLEYRYYYNKFVCIKLLECQYYYDKPVFVYNYWNTDIIMINLCSYFIIRM